jgi:hypothetical protein
VVWGSCAFFEIQQENFEIFEEAVEQAITMSTQQNDVQWFHAVQAAFPDEELRKRIWVEAHQPTQLPRLFEDMARYVLSLKTHQQQQPSNEMPTNLKKRKLDDGSAQANGTATIANAHVMYECRDVSVQIPARKKLRVQFVEDESDIRRGEVRLVNLSNDNTEYSLPVESIEQAFCLPVPDKQQRQSYFVILPKPGATAAEQILFTLNDTPLPDADDETNVSSTRKALSRLLRQHDKDVTVPDAAEFASMRPQHHRKGEKGYHVNAHRGSKEGNISQNPIVTLPSLTFIARLPLLPDNGHLVRLQETPGLLPFPRHRIDLLHLRLATHLQPRHISRQIRV